MNARTWLRLPILVLLPALASPAAASTALGSPGGAARSRSGAPDTGCFGSSSARGGKAKAAAVVGSAVGAAIGGPLLARALPFPGPGASFATRLLEDALWSTAWSGYLGLLGSLAGSSPAPLFVQVGPGQFASWSGSSLPLLTPLDRLGPLAPASFGVIGSPGRASSTVSSGVLLDGGAVAEPLGR